MATQSYFHILAALLDLLHILLMLFILFGWLIPRFRIMHLMIIVLTGLSWMVFGSSNAYGNCILTEWHWQILAQTGETGLPETYAQYLFGRITGISIAKGTALAWTRSVWLLSFILSLVIVLREYNNEHNIEATERN
jgi:hypothetical protein